MPHESLLTSQVYRICQAAAQSLEEGLLDAPSAELQDELQGPEETVYGMVDGSMLLTDDGWKETKVGRVFTAQAAEKEGFDKAQWQMGRSEYVAHLGHFEAFTTKFEQLLPPESPAAKVFVSDGARWIAQWLQQAYPEATHILDYYHLTEKLAVACQGAEEPEQWLEDQSQALLEGKSRKVEQAVQALPFLEKDHKDSLVGYLHSNHQRMRYKEFRKRKLMISSAPVEAAHRTLLQLRMKRSGQRWSDKGANNMIKLRTAFLSQIRPSHRAVYELRREVLNYTQHAHARLVSTRKRSFSPPKHER